MNKPKDYEKTNIGSWEPLEPGGHKCVIMKVEETKSKSGKEMLIIYFDTSAEDTQPGFYKAAYEKDKNPDKKWKGTGYLVTDSSTEYGTKNLKTFITAVSDSNEEFEVEWGNNFTAQFKGKNVGIVFRLEDYLTSDGQVRSSCKPFYYRKYETVFDQTVPERKRLEQKPETATGSEDFMKVSDDEEGLPFN